MKLKFILILLMSSQVFGQGGLSVDKAPGDPTTITINSATPAGATHYKLQSSPSADGTWTDESKVSSNVTQFNFPAPPTPKFYRVITMSDTVQSSPSNLVSINILMQAPLIGIK